MTLNIINFVYILFKFVIKFILFNNLKSNIEFFSNLTENNNNFFIMK